MNMQHGASPPTILVLNSGSSSLKFGLFAPAGDDESLLLEGSAEGIGRGDGSLRIKAPDGRVLVNEQHVLESQTDALQELSAVLGAQHHAQPAAVGHRVVHGGPHLRTHQRLTPEVRQRLQDAVHFAPLHIPPALALIDEAQSIFADAAHFACFDTAFHATLPPRAAQLALPRRYADAGVIRYGFHGLSYESLVTQLGAALPPRAVFAHLGNGSSVCALRDGRSVDTSMGMTPTGGVPMGTRCGDLDPGVLLYLLRVVIEKKMFSNTEDLLPVISFNAKGSTEEMQKHEHDLAYVALDGNIGCMVNGAGHFEECVCCHVLAFLQ